MADRGLGRPRKQLRFQTPRQIEAEQISAFFMGSYTFKVMLSSSSSQERIRELEFRLTNWD